MLCHQLPGRVGGATRGPGHQVEELTTRLLAELLQSSQNQRWNQAAMPPPSMDRIFLLINVRSLPWVAFLPHDDHIDGVTVFRAASALVHGNFSGRRYPPHHANRWSYNDCRPTLESSLPPSSSGARQGLRTGRSGRIQRALSTFPQRIRPAGRERLLHQFPSWKCGRSDGRHRGGGRGRPGWGNPY